MQPYRVLFFKTFQEARQAKDTIAAECQNTNQLNVVIKEEGNMDDPSLLGIDPKVKVFAGDAWTLIHERRLKDGWYPS